MRVLVVDDNDDDRELLVRVLRGMGMNEIVEARSGADALVELNLSNPDLVFFDWLMPFQDGVSLIREYREEGNSTPIVMVSAVADDENRQKALDAGVDLYLTKPYEIRDLKARVAELLREAVPEFSPRT
ncbi:MAG: response regulator [Planctomycetes bacterium]|nr:response regulator [Planctomycetota bacterium]